MLPKNKMRPIHPGEVLREEFLRPLELSANAFAAVLGVPTNRVTEILNCNGSVTADTALRLARALDTSPESWLNLQQAYDLRVAEEEGQPIGARGSARGSGWPQGGEVALTAPAGGTMDHGARPQPRAQPVVAGRPAWPSAAGVRASLARGRARGRRAFRCRGRRSRAG